jgi:DNA-binding transcriptional LysR family regulator
MEELNWDALKTLLAVSEAGSINGAGQALGVSHSTVLRRVDGLEAAFGTQLLLRHRSGCSLTPAGEVAVSELREVAARMEVLARRVQGHRQTLDGSLRITTLESAAGLVLPLLSTVRRTHPMLSFEVLTADHYLDLARGEADLAIRLTGDPPADLVGRRHGHVALAVYGHRSLVAGRGEACLKVAPWAVLGPGRPQLPQAQWERRHVPQDQVWLRTEGSQMLWTSVVQGLGLGILACALADPDPDLIRLTPPLPELQVDLWTLYHRELRQAARLRVVHEELSRSLARLRPLLEGEVPQADQGRALLAELGMPRALPA